MVTGSIDGGCQVCGRPARVRILEDYVAGSPVYRQYCLTCADAHEIGRTVDDMDANRPRTTTGTLIVIAGLTFGMFGVFGHRFGIAWTAGLGPRQQAGIVAGVLLIMLGALLRVDAVAVVGMVVFGLAACADLIGLGGFGGSNVGQQLFIAVGLMLTCIGLALRWRAKVKARSGGH